MAARILVVDDDESLCELPHIDGFEFAAALRADATLPHIPGGAPSTG